MDLRPCREFALSYVDGHFGVGFVVSNNGDYFTLFFCAFSHDDCPGGCRQLVNARNALCPVPAPGCRLPNNCKHVAYADNMWCMALVCVPSEGFLAALQAILEVFNEVTSCTRHTPDPLQCVPA